MNDPRTDPVTMSQRDAEVKISNEVYAATELFERLEGAGLITGNGHHLRQQVADYAEKLLRERWRGEASQR